MVDAHDSKSCIARCGGSSPLSGTTNKMSGFIPDILFCLEDEKSAGRRPELGSRKNSTEFYA